MQVCHCQSLAPPQVAPVDMDVQGGVRPFYNFLGNISRAPDQDPPLDPDRNFSCHTRLKMFNQDLERRSPTVLRVPPPHKPKHNKRQDTFSRVEWMHQYPSRLPLVPRASTSNTLPQHPYISMTGNEKADEDAQIHDPEPASIPLGLIQVSTSHEGASDSTMHFSLDVTDDIESHLEEVARLKRWGHFNEAREYFGANLEHHLDLPLVVLEYCDLLVEQGSYHQFSSFVSNRQWDFDQKTKCLPIGKGETGPELYKLHYDLLSLRAKIPFEGASSDDLDVLQILAFCDYLDKRATSRQGTRVSHGLGMPFDSTEVQIIRHQLEIQSDVKQQGMTYMTPFRIHCWPELYKVLLMDGRIWELCDLLLAMFHSYGLMGTWDRLFDGIWETKAKTPQEAQCLDKFLKDWTLDEYDEATELGILRILVEIHYQLGETSSVAPENRPPLVQRCVQQAEQCAADIKEYSPHLTKSRPYLRWILTKEKISRLQNESPSCKEQQEHQIQRSPGFILNEGCLPMYIPANTENAGWPAPDPAFPSNGNLEWALTVSKALLDYKTHADLLKELICRVQDPRPFFEELDQLSGLTQGDRVQLYGSYVSQYLLAIDDSSCRKLLERLESAASEFEHDAIYDVCVATRWNGLMVQIALGRLIYEDIKAIRHNALLAELISEYLPESKPAMVVRFSRSTSYDEGRKSRRNRNRWDADDFSDLAPQGLEISKMRESTDLGPCERKLRRELEDFEYEQRLNAGKAEIRKRLREESSKNDPAHLHKEVSRAPKVAYKQIEELKEQQGIMNSDIAKSRQPEEQSGQDTIHLTPEPEEIDDVGHTDQAKPSQESRKPYRYASVTEVEDESTMSKTPEQTSNQMDRVFGKDLINEEGRSSSGESGVTAEEREEATSGNQRPSRAGSPLMIEYAEEVLD